MTDGLSLTQLRDLHLPEPIGWWPPAIGWWLLLGLLLCGILATVLVVRARRQQAWKRTAFVELSEIRSRYAREQDGLRAVKDISSLLRRTCLSIRPRQQVAALTGSAWLHYLDELGNCQQFSTGKGRQLIEAPYRKQPAADVEALFELCSNWLQQLPGQAARED